MLLFGYLYGTRSKRRLDDGVSLNIAYRWVCGFRINDIIPDRCTLSKNIMKRLNDNRLFVKCLFSGSFILMTEFVLCDEKTLDFPRLMSN